MRPTALIMPSRYDTYTSPLATRNASEAMLRLWSPRHRFNTWRRIWLAVAQAQHEFGLPVSAEQVRALRDVVEQGITDADIDRAAELERSLRHDVMSHVHALGERCPQARPILHLGLTSEDVVSNADLLIISDALRLVAVKIARVIVALGDRARETAGMPTLGLTHYQPAQPTTVGRRLAGYAHDLSLCLQRVEGTQRALRFRGLRGATGTQASFMALCDGDMQRIDAMERAFARVGGDSDDPDAFVPYRLSGQTYPRVVDCFVLADLSATAAVAHKIATDIRLLAGRKECDEPFESRQVGSSAMPYKRNPMRCERICGLARFVMHLAGNSYETAATQWFERTLDDSSNRRLVLPEAFLALDGVLDLLHNVVSALVVHEAMVRRNLLAELPFLAAEHLLLACVRLGGDRQDYHERIRVHAQATADRVKDLGLDNDLIERLKADRAFWSRHRGGPLAEEIDWNNLLDPMRYVGRSVEQTERFLQEVVRPTAARYGEAIARLGSSSPAV